MFIPKIGEKYYYIDDWWNLPNDYEDAIRTETREEYETEDIIFVMNKVSRTLEEAVEHYKFLKAEAELKLAIAKINNGWTLDWNDENQRKWYIYYASNFNKLYMDSTYSVQRTSNESYLLFLKDSESTRFIIKNYKKQLLIYFHLDCLLLP